MAGDHPQLIQQYGWIAVEGTSLPHLSLAQERPNTGIRHSCSSDLKLRHSHITFVNVGTSSTENTVLSQQRDTDNDPQQNEACLNSIEDQKGRQLEESATSPVAATEIFVSDMTSNDLYDSSEIVSHERQQAVELQRTVISGGDDPQQVSQTGSGDTSISCTHDSGTRHFTRSAFSPPTLHRVPSPTASASSEEIILFIGRKSCQPKASDITKTSLCTETSGGQNEWDRPRLSRQLGSPPNPMAEDPMAVRLEVARPRQGSCERSSFGVINSDQPPNVQKRLPRTPPERRLCKSRSKQSRRPLEGADILADYISNAHDFGDHVPAYVQRDLGDFDSIEWSDDSLTDKQPLQDLQDDSDNVAIEKGLKESRSRKESMIDENLARLLLKQGELGFDADDRLPIEGISLTDDGKNDKRHQKSQLDELWERPMTRRSQPRSGRKKQFANSFRPMTSSAEVLERKWCNGFDVMDQERPSLRKRLKSRRGKITVEVSDSELEQSLQTAWDNDRTKKKIRKQEHEKLRAQGLIGKGNKVDMKAKYPEGITLEDVKMEVKEFLLSSKESLSLPPMGREDRKLVHTVAIVFGLKSKSLGAGRSRFPVLERTSRTTPYNERIWNSIQPALSRGRFLPRFDKNKKRPIRRARGGGAVSAGVYLRDGEVVGATAPELGQENRGRAILERMGWSTGTALGALNNTRGIVEPVAQVVKTSKAGLG